MRRELERGAVLMAVFHPVPALLQRQVRSLQVQSRGSWVCIVGIDGRDPATLALVSELVAGDDRFVVKEYAENVGHYRNFERLTHEAPSDAAWVAYCDQDDYWYPDKLERLVSMLDTDPEITAVMGQAVVRRENGDRLGVTKRDPRSLEQLMFKNQVTGSLAIFRRPVLTTALPFASPTSIGIHDHWLAVCAAALGRVVTCDVPVQDYVQHEGNAIGEAVPNTMRSHVAAARRAGGPLRHLDHVSLEQWGWRVSMATALLARLPDGAGGSSRFLRAVMKGRPSPALVVALARQVRAGAVPVRTALSIGAASLWWPFATQRHMA